MTPQHTRNVSALQDKQLLLMLDNVEHVAGAAPYLAQLVEHAPGLTILAISRPRCASLASKYGLSSRTPDRSCALPATPMCWRTVRSPLGAVLPT
jgi:hypothetical protein